MREGYRGRRPLPTAPACRSLELLDISEGVYISGEVAFRPEGVEQSAGAAGGGRLVAKPITLKRDSFIGPTAFIQPGAVFEVRAGACESGVTAAGAIIKSGTATVGGYLVESYGFRADFLAMSSTFVVNTLVWATIASVR